MGTWVHVVIFKRFSLVGASAPHIEPLLDLSIRVAGTPSTWPILARRGPLLVLRRHKKDSSISCDNHVFWDQSNGRAASKATPIDRKKMKLSDLSDGFDWVAQP